MCSHLPCRGSYFNKDGRLCALYNKYLVYFITKVKWIVRLKTLNVFAKRHFFKFQVTNLQLLKIFKQWICELCTYIVPKWIWNIFCMHYVYKEMFQRNVLITILILLLKLNCWELFCKVWNQIKMECAFYPRPGIPPNRISWARKSFHKYALKRTPDKASSTQ